MASTDDYYGYLIDSTFQFRAAPGTATDGEGVFALVDAQGYQLVKIQNGTVDIGGTVTALDFLPTQGVNPSTTLQYDGSDNLGTVLMGIGAGTYIQTLSYGTDGATLTDVSVWGTL